MDSISFKMLLPCPGWGVVKISRENAIGFNFLALSKGQCVYSQTIECFVNCEVFCEQPRSILSWCSRRGPSGHQTFPSVLINRRSSHHWGRRMLVQGFYGRPVWAICDLWPVAGLDGCHRISGLRGASAVASLGSMTRMMPLWPGSWEVEADIAQDPTLLF